MNKLIISLIVLLSIATENIYAMQTSTIMSLQKKRKINNTNQPTITDNRPTYSLLFSTPLHGSGFYLNIPYNETNGLADAHEMKILVSNHLNQPKEKTRIMLAGKDIEDIYVPRDPVHPAAAPSFGIPIRTMRQETILHVTIGK